MLLKVCLNFAKPTVFVAAAIITVNRGIQQIIRQQIRESHLMHSSYGIPTLTSPLGHEEGRI